MTSSAVSKTGLVSTPHVSAEAHRTLSATRVAVLLGVTIFLAVLAYYLVGVDEGMMSMFGKTVVVHEWVHDSRHFLGFPCH